MALNFPASPVVNQTYTYGGTIYTWDGYSWLSSVDTGLAFTVTDETSTSETRYLTMVATTGGNVNSVNVSSSKLYFTPSTGQLNATIFNSLSDERNKKNVIIIYNALETVNKLVGVEYDWTGTDQKGSGLIAQRVEEVIPHLVHTNDDGVKSLNYDGLIAYLIEAIKELSRKLEDK